MHSKYSKHNQTNKQNLPDVARRSVPKADEEFPVEERQEDDRGEHDQRRRHQVALDEDLVAHFGEHEGEVDEHHAGGGGDDDHRMVGRIRQQQTGKVGQGRRQHTHTTRRVLVTVPHCRVHHGLSIDTAMCDGMQSLEVVVVRIT